MEFVTITAVIPQKGSTFLVSTDHGEAPISLDYEIIYCKGICQNRKFTLTQWEEIIDSEMLRKARNLALKLLTGRDMTSGALYKKLTERCIDPKAAAQTVSRCIELGEINDWQYALRAANYCLSQKRYGNLRAYQWMIQKGIPKDTARQALEQVSPQVDTAGQLELLIERRYAEKLADGDYRQKQNVIAALARRGYRISEIQSAIADFMERQHSDEAL